MYTFFLGVCYKIELLAIDTMNITKMFACCSSGSFVKDICNKRSFVRFEVEQPSDVAKKIVKDTFEYMRVLKI